MKIFQSNPSNQEFSNVPQIKENQEHFELLSKMNSFVVDNDWIALELLVPNKDERKNGHSIVFFEKYPRSNKNKCKFQLLRAFKLRHFEKAAENSMPDFLPYYFAGLENHSLKPYLCEPQI